MCSSDLKRIFDSFEFGDADRRAFRGGAGWPLLIRRNLANGPTMALRRDALLEALPIPPGWIQDYYLVLTLAASKRVTFVEEPLVRYRLHASQKLGIARGGLSAPRELLRLARAQDEAYHDALATAFTTLREQIGRAHV